MKSFHLIANANVCCAGYLIQEEHAFSRKPATQFPPGSSVHKGRQHRLAAVGQPGVMGSAQRLVDWCHRDQGWAIFSDGAKVLMVTEPERPKLHREAVFVKQG